METYLTRVTDYLLTQSWQIALLVVVIAAVSLVLRNKSAHVRYLLWLIVLAKCLVPPLLTVPVAILPQEKPAMVFEAVGTTISEPPELPLEPVKLIPAPIVREKPTKVGIREWLGAGWMVGITVFLVFNLLKALRASLWLWRQRKPLPAELLSDIENLFSAHGIKNFPDIWQIDGISQPFVWGLLHGSIYLPADLLSVKNSKRCKSLLGHELSHIIRFDAAVNFLQVIVQAIFWFHPFVWWANRKIRAEREKSCDEMAIARLNTSPRDYSTAIVETLVAKYESTRPVPSLAIAGPVKNIEERIKIMMKPGKKFYKRPSLITATIVLLVALLTVPTALVLTARAETKVAAEREDKATKSLHQAAKDGDIEQVKLLISKGVDINAKDKRGDTPLHKAADKGHREVVELLITNGAAVKGWNNYWRRPLHVAAREGHRHVVELLLDKGAWPNASAKFGQTPLHFAAPEGRTDVVELLIHKGADVNAKDADGETPLATAARGGHRDMVELLIANGADFNAKSKGESTPLHSAASGGYKDVMQLLIAKGADVNAETVKGETPLHYAATFGHKDAAELLLDKGADIDAKHKHELGAWTPFFLAANFGRKDVAELLLARGADMNVRDIYNYTPLHGASWKGHKDVVEFLIAKGADVKVKDNFGRTPLHVAAWRGRRSVVELLLAKGADVNATKENGETPLHRVAAGGHKTVVGLLLARGAEVNAKTKEGKTPLSLAKEKGHQEIVELLRKHGAKE